MKPSGIDWLGPIGDDWDIWRARFLCDVQTGSGDTVDAVDEGKYPFYVRSETAQRSDSYDFDAEAVLTSGDGAGVGKVFHLVRGRFKAHQRVYVLSNFRHVEARYFYYVFSSFFHQVALDGSAKSTVDSVRRRMITDFPIPMPEDKGTQRAIVDYLDFETAQIDAFIAKNEQLTSLLAERRAAVISEAITGNLDIPGISRSWRVGRVLWTGAPNVPQLEFRRLFAPLSRPVPEDAQIITAYTDGQVTLRSNRTKVGYHEAADLSGFQGVKAGDFVVHGLDIMRGSVGVSDSDGAISAVCTVCRPIGPIEPQFAALAMRVQAESGLPKALARGVREGGADFRRWGTLAELPLPVPPLDYQRSALKLVASETKRIDAAIDTAQRGIVLARERRAALISAAVTGQIDIGRAA